VSCQTGQQNRRTKLVSHLKGPCLRLTGSWRICVGFSSAYLRMELRGESLCLYLHTSHTLRTVLTRFIIPTSTYHAFPCYSSHPLGVNHYGHSPRRVHHAGSRHHLCRPKSARSPPASTTGSIQASNTRRRCSSASTRTRKTSK
jgi:hypothetical protein